MAESYRTSNSLQQDDSALDSGMGQQTQASTLDDRGSEGEGFQAMERNAADGLNKVKDTAERTGNRVKSGLAQATKYVKSMDASDMWGDVKELARRNPGASMLTMAVIGFALGRTVSRRTR